MEIGCANSSSDDAPEGGLPDSSESFSRILVLEVFLLLRHGASSVITAQGIRVLTGIPVGGAQKNAIIGHEVLKHTTYIHKYLE